jgi:hypothetical protein
MQKGSTLANVGIVLGWIGVLILLAGVVAGIASLIAVGSSGGTPAPVTTP